MRFTSVVAPALLVLAVGCVGTGFDNGGDGDDDGGDSGTAKAMYTSDVHAIVQAKCGAATCHGQPGVTGVYGFGTSSADTSYTQITALPTLVGTYTAASAGLLTKIHQPGGHNSVTYTSAEEAKISSWLAKEAQERSGSMPPIDPVAKLRDWSGCMSLEQFTAANMPTAWGQLAAGSMRCANCHGYGLDTFLTGVGNNGEDYFNGLATTKDFLLKYFTVDATGQIIINTASMQNAATTLPGHPRFDATTNAGMTALTEFYNLTKTRQMTNTPTPCDPPRLTM